MYKLLKRLSMITFLAALVAARIPCWGPIYQPETPKKLEKDYR